jgi:hypothetical protein
VLFIVSHRRLMDDLVVGDKCLFALKRRRFASMGDTDGVTHLGAFERALVTRPSSSRWLAPADRELDSPLSREISMAPNVRLCVVPGVAGTTSSELHRRSEPMTRRTRRAHRVPVRIDVDLIVDRARHRGWGRATDISIGGMFIETTVVLPLAAAVAVRLRFQGIEGPIELPAVVRWATRYGMGVQFKLLGALETHAITEIARASAALQRAAGRTAA